MNSKWAKAFMWAQFGLVTPPDGEPADPRHVEAARKRLAIELVDAWNVILRDEARPLFSPTLEAAFLAERPWLRRTSAARPSDRRSVSSEAASHDTGRAFFFGWRMPRFEFTSAFGGVTDMANYSGISIRSRMTPNRTSMPKPTRFQESGPTILRHIPA